jgi:hypothetical protein
MLLIAKNIKYADKISPCPLNSYLIEQVASGIFFPILKAVSQSGKKFLNSRTYLAIIIQIQP